VTTNTNIAAATSATTAKGTDPAPGGPACLTAPANEQQAGLWFIHQTHPDCAAYHIVFAAEVTAQAGLGPRIRGVLDELIRDYAALRTCFAPGAEGPVIEVCDGVTPDIRIADARGLSTQELRERVRSDSRIGFDLSRPPLWRIHVYRTSADTWVFAVVLHHAAFDFWSLALLLGEVRSRMEGTAHRFALDGTSFAAYAQRQRQYLAGETARELLEAEVARLADGPAALDLYGDAPRPPVFSYDGASIPFTIPAAATEAVGRLARESSATPYMVLMTAYLVMLSRLSGQSDLTVGTPTSGRTQRRFRDAIGNFVNTVVVRAEVDERRTGREQLAHVRERVLEALRAQELPFPRIVRELAPPRDPSRTPLYQAGFAWDRLPFLTEMGEFFLLEPGSGASVEIAGAVLRPFPVAQQEGQTDLWIEMGAERDGAYGGVLRYNADLFAAGTAGEIAAAFVATVRDLVGAPDAVLAEHARCDAPTRARLAEFGTGPALAIPAVRLPRLVREQARRAPDAVALVADGEEWSYSALMEVVDDIARSLRAAGVAPGDRVAVMAERGARLVAALLGVMEAGAAYVPLDPHLPADRLAYMAADSRAGLLLSQLSLKGEWPAGLPVLILDDPAAGVVGGADRQPAVTADAGIEDAASQNPASQNPDLAYVLYTSGSTGRPKGVGIGHRALVNLLLSMREVTGFDATDSLLAVTTVSFDIAGLELFMPLIAGGRVLICDGESAADGRLLAARIEQSGATWMQATPTSWRMLRDAGWQGGGGLHILCGGEELPAELARFLTAQAASVHNVYGPTETTIWSTAGPVDPDRGIDLGRPLANTQLHVLDPQGREVEPGFPGELWIGGDGLAVGYWDRPQLTAERFVTGLPAAPDRRLYRTGDRARWTGDGRLLHHGRTDNQVKLRGYRIELAEVEAVLRALDGVSEAVVVVRDDRLVGYLIAEPGVEPSTSEIRATAAQSLPQYMVPGNLMVLDEFPLTANKKIDRNRLPAPAAASSAAFEKPRDAVEITLARMWCTLLDLPEAGVHDDFFDLGGHSLLAVRLTAAIQDEWGLEIPVSALLRHGTIARLAAVVRAGGEKSRSPIVALRQGTGAADERPLFLFHPFGGTVFCYVELTRHLPGDGPVLAIEAPGIETEGEAEVSVEAMAERYVEWIREIQPAGPYRLGGWCFGGVIAYEAAGILEEAGERIELIAAIDSRAPIEANIPDTADDSTLLSWFARDLAVPYGKTLDIPAEHLRDLGDAAFDHILEQAAAAGVLAEDADRARILRYFEAYLANGIALQTYLPEPRDLDLVLLRAADEPADYGPTLGWAELITGSLRVLEVPGDHNSVMYPPHAAVAARAIAPFLEGRD
jgi:amino acid adenylation domain-containing protein